MPIDGAEPVRPVITSGREPTRPDEIALGSLTMREAGLRIGDEIELRPLAGSRPPATFTVVGTTMVTDNFEPRVGAGGVLDPAGLERIAPEASGGIARAGHGWTRPRGRPGEGAGGVSGPVHGRGRPDEPAERGAHRRTARRHRWGDSGAGRGDADSRPPRLRAPPAPRARRVQVARVHPSPGRRRGDHRGHDARRWPVSHSASRSG